MSTTVADENKGPNPSTDKPRVPKRKTGRKAGVGRGLKRAREGGVAEPLAPVAVRLPAGAVATVNKVLDSQYERAPKGQREGINMSDVLRGIFALGLHEYKLRSATTWVTARHPVYALNEVAAIVDLDVDVLVRELASRGIIPREQLLKRVEGLPRPTPAPATPAAVDAIRNALH